MNKFVINAAVGLSILASSLAVSAPASAFQLQNFANQNLYLGVAAGTPKAGTPFIVWTKDSPRSANQTFSVTNGFSGPDGGSPASSVVVNQTVHLYNGVAYNAVVGTSSSKPTDAPKDGTSVVVETVSPYVKQQWKVDPSQVLCSNYVNGVCETPCYRFIDAATYGITGVTPEALGVAGGNPQLGQAIITWHTFSDWWNHLDQFWCAID